MHFYQRTLSRPVTTTGIGLHSGRKVNLCLRPAEPDTGILFKRSDLSGAPLIPCDARHVVDTRLSTTIGLEGVTVSTVEHLMSALMGMGVDNALVEVDSPEVPIMDGSAAPFVFLIKNTGLTSQARPRQFYRVLREVSTSEGDKFIKVSPSEHLAVEFTIEFPHPAIRRQQMAFRLDERAYEQQLSRARTFGFMADMDKLHKAGLALGGSLDNAVVVDNFRVLNDDGLRFPDEFVRHKVLDFLGDMALIGKPILGTFQAFKSGHQLNNQLFRKLLADPLALQLVQPQPSAPAQEKQAPAEKPQRASMLRAS